MRIGDGPKNSAWCLMRPESTVFLCRTPMNPSGIFVRIPDVAASTVEITLEDAKGGESREAALTELKLCGVRLR